jgi:hypothetical protein
MNLHNTQTAERANGILNLPQRKGQGKEINPQHGNSSKQTQQKATSKTEQIVDCRADLLNQRAAFKIELPTPLWGRG